MLAIPLVGGIRDERQPIYTSNLFCEGPQIMGVAIFKKLVEVTQGTSGGEEVLRSGSCGWFTVRFNEREVEGLPKQNADPGNRVAA